MILNHAQLVERELQQPTEHRMQRWTCLEGIAQLFWRGAQTRGRERCEGGRISFPVRQRLQHTPGADAQQIGHHTGDLDVGFLEERLQPIVQLYAAARDLVFAAHHGPPEPLLGIGPEAQGELLRDQALHQTFGVWKVLLAAAGPAIRLRLCEVERPREWARAGAGPALRSPVQFQRFPDGSPILRACLVASVRVAGCRRSRGRNDA